MREERRGPGSRLPRGSGRGGEGAGWALAGCGDAEEEKQPRRSALGGVSAPLVQRSQGVGNGYRNKGSGELAWR